MIYKVDMNGHDKSKHERTRRVQALTNTDRKELVGKMRRVRRDFLLLPDFKKKNTYDVM